MSFHILLQDDEYVLNYCVRYLARDSFEPRHNFGQFQEDDELGHVCESWRFPVVDSYWDGEADTSYFFNRVTFVFMARSGSRPREVLLVGNFASLYESFVLQPVRFQSADTAYYAVTLALPKGQVYTYKFIVDGQVVLDPINPQRVVLDNGQPWSRFFTDLCPELLSFGPAEVSLLSRLTGCILPLHKRARRGFLERYYARLDESNKELSYAHTQRLDQSVGVVNFIDKLLDRQERHHLIDDRICLGMIEQILRDAHPDSEPDCLPDRVYTELCEAMARDRVDGWNYPVQERKIFQLFGNPVPGSSLLLKFHLGWISSSAAVARDCLPLGLIFNKTAYFLETFSINSLSTRPKYTAKFCTQI